MQQIQMLALVFMNTLGLDIEQAGGINAHPQLPLHILRQHLLTRQFHRPPTLLEPRLIGEGLQLP